MKKRNITFIFIGFIMIESLSFFHIEGFRQQFLEQYFQEQTRELEIKYKSVNNFFNEVTDSIVNYTIRTPEVLEVFGEASRADVLQKKAIRGKLYNLLLPVYDDLRSKDIKQLHFHLPNNESFLRFHRPNKFGDNLTEIRYSVKMANLTKNKQVGFEEGRIFNGFRFVFPLFLEGVHIGSVETSFSFRAIKKQLLQYGNETYSFMVKKDIISKKVFGDEQKNYVQTLLSPEYMHEKKSLHYSGSLQSNIKELDSSLSKEAIKKLTNNENFSSYREINNEHYLVTFVSIPNVQGNPAAYIVSYKKDNLINEQEALYFRSHILSAIVFVLLAFAVFLIVQKSQRIRDKDENLQAIIDANTDIIFMVDKAGKLLFSNKQVERVLGYTRSEIMGKPFEDFVPKREVPSQTGQLEKVFLTKTTAPFETLALNKAGCLIPVEISGTIIKYNRETVAVGTIRDISERKEAERALVESEEKQRKILDTFSEGIYITTSDYKIAYINSAMKKSLGGDLVGETCHKAIYNREKKCDWCVFEELKSEKKRIEYELTTDGNKHLNIRNVLLGENEKLTIFTDISERKKAELALEASETRFRSVFKDASDALFWSDPELGLITNCNQAAEELLELSSAEIIGQKTYSFFPDEKTVGYQTQIAKSMAKKNMATGQFILITSKGKERVVASTVTESLVGGKLLRQSIVRDITEKVIVQDALEQSQLELETLNQVLVDQRNIFMIGNVVVVKWLNRENWPMEYISENAHAVLGYSKEECLADGFYFSNLLLPEDRDRIKEKIMSSLEKSQGFFEVPELQLMHKDGKLIWVYIFTTVNKDALGNVTHFYGYMTEITIRKEAEAALIQSERKLKESNNTKDLFFSIIAHDLKNPFNTILGFTDLLLSNFDLFDDAKKRKFIESIQQSSYNTFRLLENLLIWSRSQGGLMAFNQSDENLYLLWVESMSLLDGMTQKKNISIEEDIPKDLNVFVDRDMMSTVFRNLLSNAIKFTPKDGKISISVRYPQDTEGFIEFSLVDTGVGINPMDLEKIFSLAEKFSTQGTENEAGTGLGLILCKDFIEKHHGSLWVESEVGRGSRFYFTVPLKSLEQPPHSV